MHTEGLAWTLRVHAPEYCQEQTLPPNTEHPTQSTVPLGMLLPPSPSLQSHQHIEMQFRPLLHLLGIMTSCFIPLHIRILLSFDYALLSVVEYLQKTFISPGMYCSKWDMEKIGVSIQ